MGRRLTAQVPLRRPDKPRKYKQKAVSRVAYEENLYLGEIRYGKIDKRFIHQVRRPKVTDPGIADRIFAGLIAGKSLDAICTDDPNMPWSRDVYLEVAKDSEGQFAKDFHYARQLQQDALVGDTLSLADSATEDNYNSLRLKIQARQWHASRVAPKKYGDRIDGQVAVQVININVTSDEYAQISRRISDQY